MAAKDLHEPGGGLYILPYPLKGPETRHDDLESGGPSDMGGLPQDPPALFSAEQKEVLKEGRWNPKSLLEVAQDLVSITLFCQFWP